MHSRNYYRIRTAVRTLFWVGVLVAAYYLVNSIWWTGTGWHFGAAPSL